MPKSKKKVLKGCQHDGDFYPLRGEKSLRQDAIVGWVVDVMCGKCRQTGIAAVNYKRIDWDEKIDGSDGNAELVRRYGPFTAIGREQEARLIARDEWRRILTIKSGDDDNGKFSMHAHVGHGLVNVDIIFQSTNPMPEDLEIPDFWFDDHLKAP